MAEYEPVSVSGKRTVVIGGTSGIGEAIALGFAADGATVVASSRDPGKVAATAEKLAERGSPGLEIACDVTDRQSLDALCATALEELGGIDALVVSQGAIARDSVASLTESEWARVTDVALGGVYRAIQTFTDPMSEGSVVNVSSLAARLAIADAAAYTAAKGGVDALTRAAAKEYAPDVRVNAIAPGFVITPQNEAEYAEGTEKRAKIDERTPMGRVAAREEIVGAAIYLASDAASYTTGEVLTVDGGFADSVF